ncbi:MAG: triphosphoribosyl-dephospho-CoA synthase [Candidatus Accumulibacter sp.]|jgi:triphosphoribosyl-dephospho-CoA synthase|nr:triphosphoribosyl-dephospho-CoA synthase [Accumulibacter sp.]
MNSSHHSGLERLAAALTAGATRELWLTPKPGLVDRIDNGSHPDLSFPLMERSIGILACHLEEIVASLHAEEPFACQREIAVRAERRFHAELGTNTHKGYVFLAGMLLIACHRAGSFDEAAVRKALSAVSRTFFSDTAARGDTHGEHARRQFGAGGIVREAIGAYPSLFEGALPVFRQTRAQGADERAAAFAMMATLMQIVDDTTTLHRGGMAGLARIRRDGRTLERIVAEKGDYTAFLTQLNDDYRRLDLTLGGVADMLGLAFGWLIFREEERMSPTSL